MPRPVLFLDIDGVLNTQKHNTQIYFEPRLLARLKIILEATDALVVLSTFWRAFHEYICYCFHRHKIDVAHHMLPLPMGATRGKQTTEKWRHYHRISQLEKGLSVETGMIGRTSEDDKEYDCRAEEIEAWLKEYGQMYLGGCGGTGDMNTNESFHPSNWKYAILDDRPSAAKANTPLYERFVLTETGKGLTEDDAKKTIELLRLGPCR
ncbi:hypothetical protein THAOC_08235 [Thalassiosira oceanica]|uniref:FCP1 homology domain-containing protein n=1 Tax=Thalassiosira oceanica TaxID=159749 RepID=K0SZI1_THAOC|nr:hypothetical protein THAOC_08235 [Thalassiosira oceanica]|eukprot:EJK70409.1 hypothetical protein THAOC_08235 [Thalassiosira oceanica]